MSIDADEAIRRWNENAARFVSTYSENGDIHREVLLNPTILDLLGSIQGKRVLDAGCGEGYLSRMLAKLGAHVVGVDYSENMIKMAHERTLEDLGIRFVHGNCEELSSFQDGTFDLIVSNMVIQDLPNYDKAISEMYRLLSENGVFIFSILHPCFITPGSGWVRSENGDKLYWKVDHYFNEGVYEQALPVDNNDKILFFHRTLTSYFHTIRNAGFQIETMIEPKPSEEMLEKYPSFEEDLRCSDFIVFKLRK